MKPSRVPPRKIRMPLPPRVDEKSVRDFSALYLDDQGKERDFSRLDEAPRRSVGGLAIVFLVAGTFALGMLVAAFFLFRSPERFSGDGVALSIVAPEQMTSGEDISYTITFTNNEPLILGNVELTVRYPEGFTLIESNPQPANVSGSEHAGTWMIGTLARGRSDTVTMKGKLVGPLHAQRTLQALLTYKPANFNSEFQEVAEAQTAIANAAMDVTAEGPDVAVPDSDVTYTITYRNPTDDDLGAGQVLLEFPSTFTILETRPARTGVEARWIIDPIRKQHTGSITVRGRFRAGTEGEQRFLARVGLGKGTVFALQKETEQVTNLVTGSVLVSVSQNGSTAGAPVQLGDLLNYSLSIRNTATTPVENLRVRMVLPSPTFDWATLEAAGGKREGNAITWTAREFAGLRKMNPVSEVAIPIRIRLRRDAHGLALADLRTEAHAEVIVPGANSSTITVNSNTIVSTINSNLSLVVEARYFTDDGTKIGDGPLPPTVDGTTRYRIRWVMENTIHELLSMKAVASLPLDVTFVAPGHVSQGTLIYNADRRTVEWTANRLPTTIPNVTIDFDVRITPRAEQRGQVVPLLGETVLEARDKETSGKIVLHGSPLSTTLDGDEFGQGKGVVQ